MSSHCPAPTAPPRARRNAPHVAQHGFTLIEMMVVIALVAILLLLGTPSWQEFQRNSALTTQANRMVASLNTARSEAMKQGLNAFMEPLTGNNWASGWRIYVDRDANNAFSATTDQLVHTEAALPDYLTVTGNNNAAGSAPYVSFNSSGYARSIANKGSANLAITLRRNDVANTNTEQQRVVIVARSGRVRACKPSTTSCSSTSAE